VTDKIQIEWQKLRQSPSYREEICKGIYQDESLRSNVQKYVLTHGGSVNDAEEIFQESIVRFFKKIIREGDFTIEKNVNSYIFGICKLTFLSSIKKSGKPLSINDSSIDLDNIKEYEEPLGFFNNESLYALILEKSSETCRKVLTYWAYNYKMIKIAELMEYKSEMMARKKKYECIQKMVDFIKSNPKIISNILYND
jgi:DNA-directed RNA polymerase specialized sigma24 family protein